MKKSLSMFLIVMQIGIFPLADGNAAETSFLNKWSPKIKAEGKVAFKSLIGSTDEYEKSADYDLPEDQIPELKINKIRFRIGIHGDEAIQMNKGKFLFRPQYFVTYAGEEWKFINSFYLKFGQKSKQFYPDFDPIRDAKDGLVSEILFFTFNDNDVNFLAQIFDYKSVGVRISTKLMDVPDSTLNKLTYDGLKKILLAYRYMRHEKLISKFPVN